jgi:hypothetical protein
MEGTFTITEVRIRRMELHVTGGTPAEAAAANDWSQGVLSHEYTHAIDYAWNKKKLTFTGCGVSRGKISGSSAMADATEKAKSNAKQQWEHAVGDSGGLLFVNSVMTRATNGATLVGFETGPHSK